MMDNLNDIKINLVSNQNVKRNINEKKDKKSVKTPNKKGSVKSLKKVSKNKEKLRKKRNKFKKNEDENDEGPPKKKQKTFDIFTNNPPIPLVEESKVIPIKENVFSKTPFSKLKLHKFMISNLEKMGLELLTSVQLKVIPLVLKGKDILVKSQTGSGKTLSYAVPLVQNLQSIDPPISRAQGPFVIVVLPTRELVMQTYNVFWKLVKPFVWVIPGYLMGGEKRKSEKARLKKGINILISTPGRLIDHLDNTNSLDLNNVKYLVIDEADRMFDLGFEKEISKVIWLLGNKTSHPFNTILLSATLSSGVDKLAGMSLKNPTTVDMTHIYNKNNIINNNKEINENLYSTPSSLQHYFVVMPTKLRLVALAAMLLWKCHLSNNPCKMIIFFSTQDSVEFHHSLFQLTFSTSVSGDEEEGEEDVIDKDFEIFKLYGNLEQKDRMKIFQEFHDAKSGVLLCTDVASRGLDLPKIDWIIQYNPPTSPLDYIHRAGRTARIGYQGNALIFLSPSEINYIDILANHHISIKEIKSEEILKILLLKSQQGQLNLKHQNEIPRTIEEGCSFLHYKFKFIFKQNILLRTLARKAYQSFIKSYATYPSLLKTIFHIKNLHLGHLATSFLLDDKPSSVAKVVSKHVARPGKKGFNPNDRKRREFKGGKKEIDKGRIKRKLKANFSHISEFGDGF